MKTGSQAALVTERGAARRALLAGTLIFSAIAILLAILAFAFASPSQAQEQTNEIVEENLLEGSPKSQWDVQGAGDPDIQGFATDISVDQGQRVDFKVKTDATNYRLDIYRMGYYGGDGARQVDSVEPSATLPQNQPDCLNDSNTGLIDCGNWGVSASWQVPANAVSGIYFVKLVREDGQSSGGSHILFIVRDDDGNSDLLFQTSDTTWQAYNTYGGNSLYQGSTNNPAGRASKVSYNRPFNTRAANNGEGEDWLFNSEYPMVRWLERNGYDVSYFTDVDSDRRGDEILEHEAFLSVGHDEYWSKGQRDKVEAARDAGVDLAFFSGNEVYWKTRWENSVDESNTPFRTLVTYKEGDRGELTCGGRCDPNNDNVWTGLWRTGGTPYDAGQPENALTGQISWVGTTSNIEVPATDGKLRFWRDTGIEDLPAGEKASLPAGTLGYEWDFEQKEYEGSNPGGRITMSETTQDGKTHKLSLYRDDNGNGQDALVFGAGTVQWSWGLDDDHDRGGFGGTIPSPDQDMQQATVNLFADMGIQPATLQSGLTPAQASTDTTAPASQITSPAADATVEEDEPVTITGTASDGDAGGVVGAVEVSVDGGETWHPATGRDDWRYTWTPQTQGQATIMSRAADDSGNLESPSAGRTVTVGPRAPATCTDTSPCTIWDDTVTPANPTENDSKASEVGVKFRSDTDGYITGVRFYKGPQNTGPHVGHLWTNGGQQLAGATFAGETASGWQEVRFDSPVQITANTTYVASYHTNVGFYSEDEDYFASAGVDNPPLHALANGHADGPNGVYKYGPSGSFPNETFQSSNYYVDVVFETSVGPDTRPPTVQSVSPASDQTGVNTSATVSAIFSEAMDAGTINANTFELRDDSGNLVPVSRGYDAGTRTATLTPDAPLANSKTYTATVKGGSGGVEDAAGNALNADKTWSFTTAGPPPPPPDEGPGGPIAVISDAANPFGRYYAEILRNEGLNEFTAPLDISSVSANTLDQYDTVILGDMPLTDAQVTMFSDWVNGGGNLIAMSPDPKLAGLLGLTNPSGTPLSEGYLKVDTTSAPGKGIVGETMQFHGAADRYDLGEARAVATLYSGANTATQNPAVTMRDVGTNGGQAAAFTYDLAKSVVYTRQGNPAWSGDERDGQSGPIRSDDLFFGAKAGDMQPDWVDLNKVAIPQADEQQRLLANLIGEMNLDKKPLPRFWYFPRGEEAVVIMTGDDHANNGTAGQFDWFKSQSPQGCSVADWECIRGTSYIYPNTPLDPTQAKTYENEGFEVALHVNTECANFTRQSLETDFTDQLAELKARYATLNVPVTNRTHCIAWSDWATHPKVELAHGIRLDTNYYYWPTSWIQNRPGMFTGSGMPMRFADTDGKMIDVYQATTQMTDESGQTEPFNIKALLDKALGSEGYYGAFTTNMHTDHSDHADAKAIVNEAKPRGVPVISARQMLEWVDGRNASSFGNMSWTQNKLNFSVNVGTGANGLQAMVPARSDTGKLTGITRGGNQVTFTNKTIKGVEYAVFAAAAGDYEATYEADTGAPVISGLTASPGADRTATISWTTDEPATSRVDYGTSPGALNLPATGPGLTTSHSVQLTGLEANTTYHYRVTSEDADGNAATSPQDPNPPATFDTPETGLTDTTTADFSAGTPGAGTHVTQTGDDGEVVLKPTAAAEFSGTALPAGWTGTPWGTGGATTVSGDNLTIDGARAGTDALYGPGRSLEYVGTFAAALNQHVGFGTDYNDSPWAMFSTGSGNQQVGLYARTHNGSAQDNTLIAGVSPTEKHRYRIEWNASNVVYYVDGTQVASHAVAIGAQMRPLASDLNVGGPAITLDWVRMSPYQSPGAFESRVLDSNASGTGWLKLTQAAQKPTGTNVTFDTRSGNTATPDGTWSAWQAVGADDTIASPNSRYIQYRANLATTDQSVSPIVEQVTLTYGEGTPDNEAPVISALNAAPGADGTATISWNTDEASTSRVEYGTSPSALNQSTPDNPTLTSAHSVGLADLEAGTTYYYRVSSTDGAGNAATSPAVGQDPATFQMPSTPPAGFTDTTTSNFSAGTTGTGTHVAQTADGEVILKPTVGAEFSGSSLPGDWQSRTWESAGGGAGGSATVANDQLTVDGAQARTNDAYGPGRSLEFVATFGAASFQTVGLATDLSDVPGNSWVQFGTASNTNTLSARINNNGTVVPDFVIPNSGSLIGTKRTYRIDWAADSVKFFVDGNLVHTENVAVGAQMRPVASDFNSGGPNVSVDWMRMSPYASPGTFTSRVFDSSKSASDWLKLTSVAQKPASTDATFETRSGDTATPDGMWSSWEQVGSDGTIASRDARYVQYRVNLSTTDASATPTIDQVTLTYREGAPDTAPPNISALDAAPTEDGSATISWTTDEPSDSRVEYGTSASSLDQSATDAARTTSHTLKLTGLQADTTYYYRVSSTDADNNTASSPSGDQAPASFQTPSAPPSSFTDTTVSDFSAGAPGDGAYVAQTSDGEDGEVILKPTVGEEFSGSSLPTGWTGTPWNSGGTSTVSGGKLTVDGARANTDALYGPGRSLEFVATFGAAQFQHVGFGVDVNTSANWAMFSTNNTSNTLWARTNNNGTPTNFQIPDSGNLIGSQHTYRIEWASNEVKFFVDGNLVRTESVTIGTPMRPLASDFNTGGSAVTVDWLRMSPYASAGTFTSRVFESNEAGSDWLKLDSTTQKPTGTSVAFETRSGNTATPDGTWSAWEAVGADGTIASPSDRHVQYRANLSTTNSSATPSIDQVSLTYRRDKAPPAATSKPDLAAASDSGPASDDDVTNVAKPTFNGTAEANSTVELFVDGNSIGTTDTDGTGNWSFTPANALTDGTYSVTAKATDRAGHASGSSEALSLKIDTAEPDTSITSGPQGTTTSTSAEFAFSSAEQGASFECQLDSAAYESCQSPKKYTGLGDGQHTFSVKAVDAAGNTDAIPAERGFTVDATGPDAPKITNPQNNAHDNDGNLEMSGTAEAASTVELFEGDTSKGTATADAQGAWSIQLTNVTEGEHTYTAKATDAAGNVSEASTGVKIIVDATAPDASLTAPDEGARVRGNDVALSADADDNTGVERVEFLVDGNVVGSDTSSPYSFAWDTTGVADGSKTIAARAHDLAGNQTTSATRTVVVDNAAPAATSKPDLAAASDSGPASDDDVTNVAKPTFNGTAEANSTVELFAEGNSIGTTNADGSGAWSFTPSNALSDGTHSVTAKATDGAGNASPTSEALSLKIDTAAPATVLQLQANGTEAGIALDWADNSEPDLAGYNVYRAASPTSTFNKLNNALLTQSQYNDTQVPAAADSYYRVTAVDLTGNESQPATDSARRPAPADTTLPTVSLGAAPANGARVRGTVTLSASASDNVGVERVEFLVGGNVVGSDTSSPYSFAWDTTGVADGSKTIAARAHDLAGNQTTSATRTVVVDNAAPTPSKPNLAAASDTGASNTDDVTKSTALTLNNGTSAAEPGSKVEIFEGTTLRGTAQVASNGTWSIQLNNVKAGVHNYRARHTDAIGNASALSEALSVTVDTSAPTITNLAPDPGSTTRVRKPAIGAIVKDDQSGGLTKSGVDLSVDDKAINPSAFSYDTSTGRLTYTPTANLSIARHKVKVVATDKAGNKTSEAWTFRVVS